MYALHEQLESREMKAWRAVIHQNKAMIKAVHAFSDASKSAAKAMDRLNTALFISKSVRLARRMFGGVI
ncbi:MAG: hypothetical protein M0R74_20040 [Dehalococcoidia bacterium]|nr:hypothetical protein [Dehalococcoidia bacterium]